MNTVRSVCLLVIIVVCPRGWLPGCLCELGNLILRKKTGGRSSNNNAQHLALSKNRDTHGQMEGLMGQADSAGHSGSCIRILAHRGTPKFLLKLKLRTARMRAQQAEDA